MSRAGVLGRFVGWVRRVLCAVTHRADYGKRYRVDGTIESPDNRQPRPKVRTVWILEAGTEAPRLITAHPV